MSKSSKEKTKEAPKSTSKRGDEGSSSKLPAARESSSKLPAAGRESSGKVAAAEPKSSSKIPAAKPSAQSSTKIPAARPSGDEGGRSGGKMKAAKPVEGAPKPRASRSEAPKEPELDEEGEEGEDGEDRPKRAMGLRGAAPWAARHAAKHAAEARKRAAEPPPPGSARATIRTPSGVEEIKARIADLHNAVERVKALRKNLQKTFYDVGQMLRDIQDQKLYTAKGFQSFESFVEREIDLSKTAALRLVKLAATFSREKALEMGHDRALDALAQLEGVDGSQAISDSKLPVSKPSMPTSVTRGPIVGR